MSAPAQRRSDEAQVLDARIDSPGREGLTGTAPTSVYAPPQDPEDVSTGPDHRPLSQQPAWRQDFPVDWPADQFVARRDFAKFLVLTSGAFVVGQGWIAAQSLIRSRRPALPRLEIARLSALPVGTSLVFSYPTDHERCLLMRLEEQVLVAFSQACTHLSCAVVPDMAKGVLHCPCHEGYFDLRTGRNIAGPPPRPLPRITLAVEGDHVYAVGIERVTV